MSIFNQSRSSKVKKNKFDLSHEKKLSTQMGKLTPIMLQEILPGDTFKVNTEIMLRMAPMIAPIMHRVNVYTHYFFVPNRIVWDNWEDFITGGKDGTSAPVHPFLYYNAGDQFLPGTLGDYLGIPQADPIPGVFQKVNALPFRAYQTIYNEYYRDQNLEDEIFVGKGDGDSTTQTQLWEMRYRAWEKDYFSSALPWAQRGPEVVIPGQGTYLVYNEGSQKGDLYTPATAQPLQVQSTGEINTASSPDLAIQSAGNSINELRKAVRLQEWLEKNARGGARYIEQLLSHFGRAPKDARLQRPEYLGGGKQPVVISEVLSTWQSTEVPQGEMAGHGISVGARNGFAKTFDEHGFVIGIMSIIPKSSYASQGIPKVFLKEDKFDYAWPEFAQIGEQPILNKEIYYDGTTNDPAVVDGTFGYTPRYAQYKFQLSTVHGDFKTSLDFWHLSRKFASAPALTKDFVKVDPAETKRIFAITDTDTDDLYVQIYHNVDAIRPLPYFGTPTI